MAKESSNDSMAQISVSTSKNPGEWRQLHSKVTDLFPSLFEGAKLMFIKQTSPNFQTTHTLKASAARSGYTFGATYGGNKRYGPGEQNPVLLGEVDANGNTSAAVIYQFYNNWRIRAQWKIKESKWDGFQTMLERKGCNSTFTLAIANPNPIGGSGAFVANILRRVTDRLDLGAELQCEVNRIAPGGIISLNSYALRYTMPNQVIAATICPGLPSLQLSYYHKLSEYVHTGVELETDLRTRESTATFAYSAEIPETGFIIRGSCDTNWLVAAALERRLYGKELPFSLALCGVLDHKKAQGRFGVGLLIG